MCSHYDHMKTRARACWEAFWTAWKVAMGHMESKSSSLGGKAMLKHVARGTVKPAPLQVFRTHLDWATANNNQYWLQSYFKHDLGYPETSSKQGITSVIQISDS